LAFFVHDRPVVGRSAFFGRESLIRAVVEGFHRQRSFAICGGPLTGRTSTLGQVIAVIHHRWSRRPSATKTVPVLIDAADALAGGARGLPALLWQSITAAVRDPRVCGDTPPPPVAKSDLKSTKEPWKLFDEVAAAHWDGMRGTGAWCEYGLLIDNADLLFGRGLEQSLDPLAALMEADAPWAPTSITAAGGRALRDHLIDDDGAFAFMRPLLLGALGETIAEKLIRTGLPDADEDLVTSVISASGKHPMVLQRILAELEQRGVQIGVEGAVDAAAGDCLSLFERIWTEFDLDRGVTYRGAYAAPEHALMQLLIDFGSGCDVKTAERELGIRPLKEYAEFLELAAVVERSLLGNVVQLSPRFDLWNIWYGERIMQ